MEEGCGPSGELSAVPPANVAALTAARALAEVGCVAGCASAETSEVMGEHGRSWESMGDHGRAWEIMGDHVGSWEIMRDHGSAETSEGQSAAA